MQRRSVAVKVLTILGGTAGAALLIFVLLPWLTSPEPAEETVEQVPALSVKVNGEEAVVGQGVTPLSVSLLPAEVEHPVMGASVEPLQTKAEESAMEAPAGELPELLPPAEVAAAMSEPVRVASAPDVEMDDGQGSANEPSVKAGNSPVQESVVAEPTPAEAAEEVMEPVVVEAVALEAVEASEQVSVEPEVPETVEVQKSSASGVPRVEFEMPPGRGLLEGPDGTEIIELPFGADVPAPAVETAAVVHDAGQAGPPHPGLPLRTAVQRPEPVPVPGTLRGAMGYRLPLVSRQTLPDQVVSGVLIPAHTTYVILQPGYWELVGLSPDEVESLRDAAANAKADKPAAQSEPVSRRWSPLNLFRKRKSNEESCTGQ